MKPRSPNLEWMRKLLADLESDRSDPQIALLLADPVVPPPPQPLPDLEPAQGLLTRSTPD
jgi:hypothetical protein